MSQLIVEVCRVERIEDHPQADKMKIAVVKGWKTCIRFDPDTNTADFAAGDICIFFPPEAILPQTLINRLGIEKYLKELPKDSRGLRPNARRVVAARLRGVPSFGVITKLMPEYGDDPNWAVGTNLVDHFKITKYEPPLETTDGDAERDHVRFHKYTSIENFGNYPNAIAEGTEVVMSEKLHGTNSRVGYVMDIGDSGEATWTYMAGSHGVRRKEFVQSESRFKIHELMEEGIFKEIPKVGDVFVRGDKVWKIEYFPEFHEKDTERILRCHAIRIISETNHEPFMMASMYWQPLTQNVKDMLVAVRDEFAKVEDIHSVVLYGEIYGSVQDMNYGISNAQSYRAFDIAVNNRYIDFDQQVKFCTDFGVEMVPILYRGPFSAAVLEEHTSGPTTMCSPEDAGNFKGREGIVVKPTVESWSYELNGRKIVKSVSADYHARKGGTEFH